MKLMIIDDEKKLLELLKEHLGEEFEVEISGSVPDAFETLKAFTPDGVIVDWNMPEGGGQKIIEALRDDDAYEFIPILVLTAYDTLIIRNRAIEAGADGYLPKPASLAQIKTNILDLISRQQEAKQLIDRLVK
ncbi:response regulator [bacterium]|nr:response regulator [bacterium]